MTARERLVRRLRRGGIADERVLAAIGTRAARALRAGGAAVAGLRGRRAPDRARGDDLAADMVARMCEELGCAATSACSTSAPAPATRLRCSRSCAGRSSTIERVAELAEQARAAARRGGYGRVEVHVGDGTLGLPEQAPFDAIVVAAAAPRRPGRSDRSNSRPRAGSSCRWAAATTSGSRSSSAPSAAGSRPLRPVPLRAARRRGGVSVVARRADGVGTLRPPMIDPARDAYASRTARSLLGSPASWSAPQPYALGRSRPHARRPRAQAQLAPAGRFCAVGASGYVVNLAVYTALVAGAGPALPARGRLLVPRRRHEQLHLEPGLDVPRRARTRCLSGDALPRRLDAGARRQSLVLHLLVRLGLDKMPAQALAIVLVTPLNFIGNKLWSFRRLPA